MPMSRRDITVENWNNKEKWLELKSRDWLKKANAER